MRGAWVNTLLLLLLASLTRTAVSQDDSDPAPASESEEPTEADIASTLPGGSISTQSPPYSDQTSYTTVSPEGSADGPTSQEAVYNQQDVSASSSPDDSENSNLMLILIPVVVVTLICMSVCGFFIIRQLKQNTTGRESIKGDPFLEEPSIEKVPMPMFEEDVPSVLELEMEDFDQWMKKEC